MVVVVEVVVVLLVVVVVVLVVVVVVEYWLWRSGCGCGGDSLVAKLQIQPESGRHYIQVVVVRTPRFSRQEQTCLRPDYGLTFLTPW